MSQIRIALLAAIAIVLALASQVHAQMWNSSNGTTWNNPMSSLASTMITGNMMQQAMKNSLAQQGAQQGAQAPGQAAPSHFAIAKSDFVSSGKRIMIEPLINSLTQAPQQRADLAKGVGQVFAMYEAKVRKNNVAYAMAFMAGMAVLADKGITLTDQQGENLALALNDQLAANPAFVKASAVDRQKLYETFVTMGSLIAIFNEVGKKDAASAAAAKQFATEAYKLMGLTK